MKLVKNEIEIDFSKFPSIGFNQSQIAEIKLLIEKLNYRKKLLSEKQFDNDFDKNEAEINEIKTNIELASMHTSVIKKEKQLEDYINNLIKPNYEDMKNKFSALMSEANIKAKTDSTLRKVLEETDWSLLADNYDHRLNHFLAIKKYLSSEKKND